MPIVVLLKKSLLRKEFEMKKIIWTITFVLLIAAALSACSSDEFPYGRYRSGSAVTEYREDGKLTMWNNDEVVTEGTFSVDGDEVTWIQDSWCEEENVGSATYRWQHEDGVLSFELIGEEPCLGRRQACSENWFGPQ
jgi:hypothetical protein